MIPQVKLRRLPPITQTILIKMSIYDISIQLDESRPDQRTTYTLELSDLQLSAIVIMLSAAFGVIVDERVTITDVCGDDIDLEDFLSQCQHIVFEGEPAESLDSEEDQDWLDYVESIGDDYEVDGTVTMKYTLKINSDQSYLIQFDSTDFLSGIYGVCQWLNMRPETCLEHYHEKNEPLDLPILEMTATPQAEPEIELVLCN